MLNIQYFANQKESYFHLKKTFVETKSIFYIQKLYLKYTERQPMTQQYHSEVFALSNENICPQNDI